MRRWGAAYVVLVCTLFAQDAHSACRQALALGLDVSGSVDNEEYQLQLNGLANALAIRDIAYILLSSLQAPVRLMVYEWSGPQNQTKIVDWVDIASATELATTIGVLQRHRRFRQGGPSTALGTAIAYGAGQLGGQSDCWKRTLDISGDGKNNTGPRPKQVSRSAVVDGIIVNGLVIGDDAERLGDARMLQLGELSAYYTAHVISGPGSFVETALGFDDFENAMKRKLLRELGTLNLSALDQ